MAGSFGYVHNDVSTREKVSLDFISDEVVAKACKFHASFPQYEKTPLVNLSELASHLGVSGVYVKDESKRFGLNAFKVLGGSFAIAKYIAKKIGVEIDELTAEKMLSQEVKEKLGDVTFVTATDGNHGRGVAWSAQQLGQKCVVYMPDGSAIERRDRIRAHGATCDILDGKNYDECVRIANQYAEEHNGIMVQDTAWPGYEEIPTWIIQGYGTMALEAKEELDKAGVKPTHIFVQAGVGSLATAVTGYFASVYADAKPVITVVEPDKAACLFKTAEANDGEIHNVTGEMRTIMAGLACGEPVTVGWPVLNSYVDNFLSVPDKTAARGMRVLGNPLKGDDRVISGESGAATAGAFYELMTQAELAELKEKIGLNQDSVVLLFSTEGDTDFDNYRKVVWDGAFSNVEL